MYGPGDRFQGPPARYYSPAVTVIKWLSVVQLLLSIIVFIVIIVLFALDFRNQNTELAFEIQLLLAVLLCLLGMGAGIAGCKMSNNESPSYNKSHKSLTMSLCLMTVFAAMFYMIFAGTISFYDVDNFGLKSRLKNYRGAFGMVVVIFILGFIQMLLAVFTIITCVVWSPEKPKRQSNYGPPEPRVYNEYTDKPIARRDRSAYTRAGTTSYGPYDKPYTVY